MKIEFKLAEGDGSFKDSKTLDWHSHDHFITYLIDEGRIGHHEGIIDYYPENFIRWSYDFLEERMMDPNSVARHYIPGIKERFTFGLVEWCLRWKVQTVQQLINLLRVDFKDKSMNQLGPQSRKDLIIHLIERDLIEYGKFKTDKKLPDNLKKRGLYYYNDRDKKIYFGKKLIAFICKEYNVSSSGPERNMIDKKMDDIAYYHSEDIDVYNLYQWKYASERLFFSSGNGIVYILGEDKIKAEENGKNILFYDDKDFLPFKLLDVKEAEKTVNDKIKDFGTFQKPPKFETHFDSLESKLFKLTSLRCNFSPNSILSVEEQQILYFIVLHVLPFVTLMQSIPIVSAHGQPGAGKTFAMLQLLRFINGTSDNPDPMPENRSDFWVVIGSKRLIVFDNVETVPKWFPDAIASVSTGAKKTKRTLFTDWDTTVIDPKLMICLTSVKAPYRQPAVVDRLIPFSFSKFDRKEVRESSLPKLFQPYANYRDELMTIYLDNVNKIAKAINKRGGLVGKTNHRMADFAILSEIINEALGLCEPEFFDRMMENLIKQRSAFALFDKPWWDAFVEIVKNNLGEDMTATELCNKMNDHLQADGLTYNASTVGKFLREYQNDLNTIFKFSRKSLGGKHYYTFGDEESGRGILNKLTDLGLEYEDTEEPGKKLNRFVKLISQLFNESKEGIFSEGDIYRKTHEAGLDIDWVKSTLEQMRRDGAIYQPRKGMFGRP